MEKLLIMGRGKSLTRIEELPEDITTVMLINAFWKWEYGPSYLEDEKLFDYLEDKEIILVINNCINYNEKDFEDFVKNFNIQKKFSPFYSKGRRMGLPRIGCNIFPDICAESFIKLEANNIKLESTLFHGVLLASEYYKYKDIYIIGQDWHEVGYFMNQDYENIKKINGGRRGRRRRLIENNKIIM